MDNATISIRIDKNLKNEFDTICDNFGMNISTAITVFAKKVVSERKIPFEITENDEYSSYSAELEAQDPYFDRATQAELARRIKDMNEGRNIVSKTMEELEAMAND